MLNLVRQSCRPISRGQLPQLEIGISWISYEWWVTTDKYFTAKVILFFEITKSFLPNIEEFILRLLWALWQVLIRLQVLFGLRDHFATTVAHLLPSCIIAVALCFHLSVFLTPLYIIVVPHTQRFDVLVPKIVIYNLCYLLNCKKKRRCLKLTSPLEIAADVAEFNKHKFRNYAYYN